MARTAIVNPRRKKPRRKSNKRRAYGRAAAPKRRRNPRSPRRRRRNPAQAPASSVYSGGGYRTKNPDYFNIDRVMDVTPAATAGIWAARWAVKLAGPFDPSTGTSTTPTPGFKHALAIVVASNVIQGIADSMLGHGKGTFAEIAALGFGGDLFARTRLFNDSQWVKDNLFLGDDDQDDDDDDDLDLDLEGFESESALGEPQYAVGPDGTLYEMSGAPDPAYSPGGNVLTGFESESALGNWGGTPTAANSFGYV